MSEEYNVYCFDPRKGLICKHYKSRRWLKKFIDGYKAQCIAEGLDPYVDFIRLRTTKRVIAIRINRTGGRFRGTPGYQWTMKSITFDGEPSIIAFRICGFDMDCAERRCEE